jgi:hypothetical protein
MRLVLLRHGKAVRRERAETAIALSWPRVANRSRPSERGSRRSAAARLRS